MDIEQRAAGRLLSMLSLWLLLGVSILPLHAADGELQLTGGQNYQRGGARPGNPQGRSIPYAPPAFVDRSTPMSERPFAQPFIDRSTPISERPLAPIGVGPQLGPESVPLIWCHGVWVRADRPGHGCTPQ
jgi:hypothetical protein